MFGIRSSKSHTDVENASKYALLLELNPRKPVYTPEHPIILNVYIHLQSYVAQRFPSDLLVMGEEHLLSYGILMVLKK